MCSRTTQLYLPSFKQPGLDTTHGSGEPSQWRMWQSAAPRRSNAALYQARIKSIFALTIFCPPLNFAVLFQIFAAATDLFAAPYDFLIVDHRS